MEYKRLTQDSSSESLLPIKSEHHPETSPVLHHRTELNTLARSLVIILILTNVIFLLANIWMNWQISLLLARYLDDHTKDIRNLPFVDQYIGVGGKSQQLGMQLQLALVTTLLMSYHTSPVNQYQQATEMKL